MLPSPRIVTARTLLKLKFSSLWWEVGRRGRWEAMAQACELGSELGWKRSGKTARRARDRIASRLWQCLFAILLLSVNYQDHIYIRGQQYVFIIRCMDTVARSMELAFGLIPSAPSMGPSIPKPRMHSLNMPHIHDYLVML